MSEGIKRYSVIADHFGGVDIEPNNDDGRWVEYGDHAALLAARDAEIAALDRRDRDLMMEATSRHGFENAPGTAGPCIRCGHGMAAHEQSRAQPLLFWCPKTAESVVESLRMKVDDLEEELRVAHSQQDGD